MSTAPVSTAPVDRSLMEPGIMENRWCHLCPGGLGVWKRSVFVGVQSFCFTLKIISLGSPPKNQKNNGNNMCSNSLFLDVFFASGVFGPIWVPLVDLYFRLGKLQVKLTSSHFLGTKKGQNTENSGTPLNGRFQNHEVFWFWCHFTRCRSWGKFGTGSVTNLNRIKIVGMDQTSGESLNNKNECFFLKDWKKAEILESVNCFFS